MSSPTLATTALLVDDEAYFRRFVGRLLLEQGVARVVEARDGREAVELCAALRPDLVILDINMPHMDGIEALRALRQIAPATRIIMLTSIADERMVERCVEEGATYFLRKDVPAHELVAEFRAMLEPEQPGRQLSA